LSHFGSGDSSQTDQYECGICGRSFDSTVGRGAHMGQKHDDDEIKTEVIAELQDLTDKLGRTPTAQDVKQQGAYGISTYERKFGSWNDALEKADCEINRQAVSDLRIPQSELIDKLQNLADELGQTPRRQDMIQQGPHGATVYQDKFGSWNNALEKAGLEVRRQTNISNSDLLDELTRLADKLGQTPTKQHMHQQGCYGIKTYERRFNSWNDTLKEAGLEINKYHDISKSDLLDELQNLADELGRTPTQWDMFKQGGYSVGPYEQKFASWNDTLREAGLEINKYHDISKSDLLDELQNLADELGRTPRQQDMIQQGGYDTNPYRAAFGSWTNALDKVGLKHQRIRYPNHLDHKVRSTYEQEAANILVDEDIEYEYESLVFEYGNGRIYTPDFVTDQYVIEVKGFTYAVERGDDGYPDEITKAEIAMEQLTEKQYVVIQNNGEKLPADRHI
jgi:hypothetical protein